MDRASPGNTAPFLEVRAIELWRGERHLLRGISFSVHRGEALQLIGPNGVGKSTLLRVVCGLLPCEAGEVMWEGRTLAKARSEFQTQLAYFAHVNALKHDLTAFENLFFGIALRRRPTHGDCEAGLDKVGLSHCRDVPARALSAGQRRRLGFARVLLADARMWVLDEPATNLDTAGTRLLIQLMQEHIDSGGAILCAAHHFLLQGHPRARLLELS